MLKKIDSPDTVLAVEVVGKLEAGDYRTVLEPALRAMIETHGEIRCVFVFGDEYTGLTLGGSLEDSKLSLTELVHGDLSKWKRCAVVTSPRVDASRHLAVPLHDAGQGRVLRGFPGARGRRLGCGLALHVPHVRSRAIRRAVPAAALDTC